ncbi:MAG TPA: sialidase family protein [Candidatus Thermoplasmatota archaeon]|nr:sialidase family protein [Candidatus Thermoplasmatota archaeon]
MRAAPVLLVLPLLLASLAGAVLLGPGLAPPSAPATADTRTDAAPFTTLVCPFALGSNLDRPLEACNVRATAQTGPGNEIDLAMDPTDPLHLVAVAKGYNYSRQLSGAGTGQVNTPYATTFDGGLTWVEGYIQPMSSVVATLPVLGDLGRTATSESDPIVEFLNSGRVIVNTLRVSGDDRGLPNYVSDDGGATFGPQVSMAYAGGTDKQWFANDPKTGNLYLITAFSGGLGFTRSTDEGFTWSAMKKICTCDLGGIDVGFDGAVHVIGMEQGGISYTRSLDGGATWSAQKRIATHQGGASTPENLRVFRTPNIAQIAASRADQGVYVAWADHPDNAVQQACPDLPLVGCPPIPDTNIFLARSDDGGATWSAPIRVDDDPLSDVTMQFMAQVAVSPNGRDVHVAWMDQRHDPSGLLIEAYYAHSPDGGVTWEPNIKLSDAPFLSALSHHQTLAPVHTGLFVGDYIGLQASDDRAVIAFPDTRYGRADVFIATVV